MDKRVFVHTVKTPVKDENGNVVGVLGIFRDITERKTAEHSHQRRCEYVESIVATVREPLIVLDEDLKVISASRSFYLTFEVAPEETRDCTSMTLATNSGIYLSYGDFWKKSSQVTPLSTTSRWITIFRKLDGV